MAPARGPSGLIDTNILIDGARGLADANTFLALQAASSAICISIISAMELVVGCRNASDLVKTRQLLQSITVLPVSETISQMAFQLLGAYFLSHSLLIADALIAATAIEHGMTLYPRNVRDFQMIPALTVVRPY